MMICGNQSAMGKEVFEALKHSKVFGDTEEKQSEEITKMKGSGDILMELWGE
jgi:hypothetical protein